MNFSIQAKERIKGSFGVFLLMTILLVMISFTLGWNLLTLLIYWFMIIPSVAFNLPPKISKNETHCFESLAGMGLFYGFMVFMIYSHYQSDYFKLMMVSAVINLLLIWFLTKSPRQTLAAESDLS